MSKWGFGYAFDMELDTPLDFFDVTYKNGEKVRYDKRPHGEWIPCSERLPEYGVQVLFCDIDGDIYIGHKMSSFWWSHGIDDRVKNVIAWMPLPEPYKRGEQND